MSGAKRAASLSLDLDDAWTYLRAAGRPGWETAPSVIPLACGRLVELMAELGQRLTLFVVGRDLSIDARVAGVQAVAAAGHEIGCHSFDHRPDFAILEDDELRREIVDAADLIAARVGARPVGFRAPGYAKHPRQIAVLRNAGFRYDGSSLPTFLGPLCRLYYFRRSGMSPEERRRRTAMYGGLRDALASNRLRVDRDERPFAHVPVTTFPMLRLPIHLSYVLWLAQRSEALAVGYVRSALATCRALRVEPSYLLHSLDFVGGDDRDDLGFFPGMKLSWADKRRLMTVVLRRLQQGFDVMPMAELVDARLAGV